LEKLSAEQKAKEFLKAALEDSCEVLLCARGGESCADILPFLDPFKTDFKQATIKKKVLGMSDNTPLLLFLADCGWPAFYGHVAAFFTRELLTPITHESFLKCLNDHPQDLSLKPLNPAGKQLQSLEAEVCGGNLTLLNLSLKESWEFEAAEKILFMEDWHELPYAVDRVLKHFERIQKFSAAKALIFGDFMGNLPSSRPPLTLEAQEALNAVLERFASRTPCPVFQASYLGHLKEIRPILLGKGKILKLEQTWVLRTGRKLD